MNKISDKDIIEWQKFLQNPDEYMNKNHKPSCESENSKNNYKKLQIDLHHLSLVQSCDEIIKSLKYAKNYNIHIISVITGIGKKHLKNQQIQYGELYQEIPKWLEQLKSEKQIRSYKRNPNNIGEIIIKL